MERSIAMQRGVLLRSMPLTISNGFNALHRYTEQTTELYERWQKEQLMLLERSFRTNGNDNGGFLNLQADLRNNLQSILFNSTFVSCIALFETQFKLICEILQTNQTKLVDAKGSSSLQKFYNFISKRFHIDLKAKDKLFNSLVLHNQIRNKIVHEQASIQYESELVRKVKKLKNIYVDEPAEGYFEIKITGCDFIYDYIKMAREYLNFVNEEILKQIPSTEVI